jgi:hypothetical protein
MATTDFQTGTVITSDWANDVDATVYQGNFPAGVDVTVDGTITMDSSFNFRNKIINGNFDFWQRGTSFTPTVGQYTADRWLYGQVGSTLAVSRQAFTLGQTDIPGEPSYFIRTAVTSVAGAGNYAHQLQRIESVRTLPGKTITVSFYAKADAAKNIAVELSQSFGSGGSPSSAVTNITPVTCALTTAWQKFTATITIPSISGKTLGTDNNDYLLLAFWFDAGSNWNSRTNTLGQQSGTFDIARVQLEEGSVATPFEERPYGLELSLCERYYEKSFLLTTTPAQNVGFNTGEEQWRAFQAGATSIGSGKVAFRVRKRGLPNLTLYNPAAANAQARDEVANADCSSTGAGGITEQGFRIGTTGNVATAIGSNICLHWTADAEL